MENIEFKFIIYVIIIFIICAIVKAIVDYFKYGSITLSSDDDLTVDDTSIVKDSYIG